MNNLTKRILVAIVGIPFGLWIVYTGSWLFAIVLSVIAAGTAFELIRLGNRIPVKASAWKAVVLSALIPLVARYAGSHEMLLVLIIALLVFSISSLRHPPRNGMLNLTLNVFTVTYTGVTFGAMVLLRESAISGSVLNGSWLVLFVMVGVWIADSAAFFVGSSIGRHKMSPVLSPNKTIEGTSGGILMGVFWGIWAPMMPSGLFGLPDRILIGLIIGSMAVLGDLTESMLKRAVEIKDSGNIIPGHGGMLDRFDSLMIVMLSVYTYLVLRGLITF